MRIRVGDTVTVADECGVVACIIYHQPPSMFYYVVSDTDNIPEGMECSGIYIEHGTNMIPISNVISVSSSAKDNDSKGKCTCETFNVVNFGCKCGGL